MGVVPKGTAPGANPVADNRCTNRVGMSASAGRDDGISCAGMGMDGNRESGSSRGTASAGGLQSLTFAVSAATCPPGWSPASAPAPFTPAKGTSARDAALEMLASAPGTGRIAVGADRGYDTRGFVRECRKLRVTPHVARKQRSAIDGRATRHEGYRLSQRTRRRIEEVFRWVKTMGGGRKLRYCGVARNRLWVELTIAGYNLVRLAKHTAVAA